ncbi:Uncharacterised protein [Escherichia coli]|nr:Uncharacterised protein [Escherichia coli]CTV53283.1 Uncharacterised protein [Escherichia coli]CTZ41567.1 Uncharacterised protein [Escherichia coli]CTZ42494.1 Uncharacterised protein [Escherichia coli]
MGSFVIALTGHFGHKPYARTQAGLNAFFFQMF